MIALLCFVLAVLTARFKSKSRLESENAMLRHQLIVLRRKTQGQFRLANKDRWYRAPDVAAMDLFVVLIIGRA